MADQDEQANSTSEKKCWDRLIKIGAWPLFAKIAVWVILALVVFFLVTKGLSGHWFLGFMAYLGDKAEPIKITTTALTMIGGIGAVGYLVIKYQERTAAQRAEQRENEQQQLARQSEEREQRGEQRAIARQQADELLDAIHLLGDDKASTRVAGVQSLVQIGQSRPEIRQRIIDILCGYLRTNREKDGAVESTILATLKEHLTPRDSDPDLLWENIDIDLRNSTITEPINLSGIVCRKFDMSETHVKSTTRPDFTEAVFTQTASFNKVTCSKGMDFKKAHFGKCLGDDPSEYGALFLDTKLVEFDFSEATLNHTNFMASNIEKCKFIKSNLRHPDFQGCKITLTKFTSAELQKASFKSCEFSKVSFCCSTFHDNTDFSECKVETQLNFNFAEFVNPPDNDTIVNMIVNFDDASINESFNTDMMTNNALWTFYNATLPMSVEGKSTKEIGTELFSGTTPTTIIFDDSFLPDETDASNTIQKGN